MAVTVQVRDGHVTYDEGASITLTPQGGLLVLDEAGIHIAKFEVGNWLDAAVED